jgi:hypothetical protein
VLPDLLPRQGDTSTPRKGLLPRVLNQRTDEIPPDAIYVGRPSKWGNPFTIGKDGTRDEVIAKYDDYFDNSDLMFSLHEIRGRDLVCWCAPEACHADRLLHDANDLI